MSEIAANEMFWEMATNAMLNREGHEEAESGFFAHMIHTATEKISEAASFFGPMRFALEGIC